jgi:hypothetical protein
VWIAAYGEAQCLNNFISFSFSILHGVLVIKEVKGQRGGHGHSLVD